MKKSITRYYSLITVLAVLVFFCNITSSTGQNNAQHQIDSLKTAFANELNEQNKVTIYNEIAYLHGEKSIDSAIWYCNKAIALGEKTDYKKGIADARLNLGRALIEKSKFPEGIENYHEALSYFEEVNDKEKLLLTYRAISYAYSYGASQITSLNYYYKAIEIAEELNDSISISVIFNNLAATYKRMEDYENAVFYFNKTLEIDLKAKDTLNIAISYSNLGVLKSDNGYYSDAEQDFRELHRLMPAISNDYLRTYFYLAFVGYYSGTAKFDSAQMYIDKAMLLCNENGFDHIKSRLYRKYGEMLFAQKKYTESISYLNKCVDLSHSLSIAEDFTRVYDYMSEAYAKLGNYKKAYQSKQAEYDSRVSNKNKELAASLARFEHERQMKAELERQSLEQELRTQKAENEAIALSWRYKLTLISSVLLLLTITMVIYFNLKTRKKNKLLESQHNTINTQNTQLEENLDKLKENEKALTKSNAAKDKLFSIIAHDLRSPFNAILGFSYELYDNYDHYDNDQRKNMISIISNSSESTLFLLENLLNWARAQNESLQIEKDSYLLKEIVDESINPYLASAKFKTIDTNNSIPENIKIQCDKATVKVVISNLYNNAIKFSRQQGIIQIDAEIKEKMAQICICDSGIGMNEEIIQSLFNIEGKSQRPGTSNEKGTGLGLILCKEFIEANNGNIWVESKENQGSKFYFTLPLSDS
jgi:signal transduction histidine kinase